MYMQKLGAEYATAENGLVAVQKYKARDHFDLVFLGQYVLETHIHRDLTLSVDISMPVMDGLTAAREIRLFERESKRSRTTIIALTGAASQSARQEAFSAGIDRFLTKPVPMKALKQLLDGLSPKQTSTSFHAG
jgi:CheY-like chemotaxis protein